jgi:hypothetical protein
VTLVTDSYPRFRLLGAMSLRGMQPAGIRGTWIRLCRLPADHP